MKAVQLRERGGPEHLVYDEAPLPAPGMCLSPFGRGRIAPCATCSARRDARQRPTPRCPVSCSAVHRPPCARRSESPPPAAYRPS